MPGTGGSIVCFYVVMSRDGENRTCCKAKEGSVGGVVRCDSGELLCQRSLWLHGFMPEGLEMQPGQTPGHPLTSAVPNFCSVEVHLEEKMSGAVSCWADGPCMSCKPGIEGWVLGLKTDQLGKRFLYSLISLSL